MSCLFQLVRFYPSGTHYWKVPENVTEVDVFLVGGGGGCKMDNFGNYISGGGGGYTKTFRGHGYVPPVNGGTWEGTPEEGRDGNAIPVTPGEVIEIIVGKGGHEADGNLSQFANSNYQAEGGKIGILDAGDGGSGGGSHANPELQGTKAGDGGSEGHDGQRGNEPTRLFLEGKGQGHTTRDFGEKTGKINAGGGAGLTSTGTAHIHNSVGGVSDYIKGSGTNQNNRAGGGYGGGLGGVSNEYNFEIPATGGDGTVLIRFCKPPTKPFTPSKSYRVIYKMVLISFLVIFQRNYNGGSSNN